MKINVYCIMFWLIFSSINAFSQSTFPFSNWAQGAYYTGSFMNPHPYARSLSYSGDTTFCGHTYAKILTLNHLPNAAPQIQYLRNDNGKIYLSISNCAQEILLYDFSLVVGDTVDLKSGGGGCGYGKYCVDSTYNITLLNGAQRKFMLLRGVQSQNQNLHWVENIGDIDYGFNYFCDMEGGKKFLVCHKENNELVWEGPAIADANCDSLTLQGTTTGLFSPLANHTLTVFPNPAVNEIFLELPDSEKFAGLTLYIYNSIGQQVFVTNYTERLSLKNFEPGVYFIRTNGLVQIIARFVKE